MNILITGANRGIGLVLGQRFVAANEHVIGTYRTETPDATGIQFEPLEVTDPASQAALASKLDGAPVDVLVCNAGVYHDKGQGLADGYPPQMWADSFATNVTGVFMTVQSLLPNLQAANGAKIAILSSQMASHTRAPGGSYIYRASKAAALNLGRNLAADLKGLDIAVGIYHPGWVQTDMGGAEAEISAAEAAAGLKDRINALSLETTGVFETWDGRAHPY